MIRVFRLFKSFKYALKGVKRTFQEEQNFRIQTVAAIIVFVAGWYLEISRTEWMFLVFVVGLVLLMELANSAVERVTDVLKPRLNEYVKEIKDIMAAAVMLASIIAIIVGIVIFYPYIFKI